jgi:hypothetical protein
MFLILSFLTHEVGTTGKRLSDIAIPFPVLHKAFSNIAFVAVHQSYDSMTYIRPVFELTDHERVAFFILLEFEISVLKAEVINF